LRWITAPEGIEQALEDGGEVERRELSAIVLADARLPAEARLDVYANAYFYRILDCLADDFGTLKATLGDDAFHNLITAYLVAHPSKNTSLRDVGAQLPEFVASAGAAWLRPDCPWAADLARLEWALVEVFDAADAPVVTREAIAAIPPDRWDGLHFGFQPALRSLELDPAVQPLRRAHDRGDPLPTAAETRSPVPVRAWRTQERVFHRMVERLDHEALKLAQSGASFGDVCLHVGETCGGDAAPGHAAALLAQWQSDGLVSRLIVD
jgi:hypothetical protein